MLYYIIYIINAVGARFIVFVPDFIAAAPIFTLSPQSLARLVGVVGGAGGGDNQLTAIPIAVGQGSGIGVMTPSLLVARGLVAELCGMVVELCGMVAELCGMVVVARGMVVAASGLMPEGVVKLISRCEIVIANRDIMISHRETVISNPETKMKAISVKMMAVGVALGVCVVIRVCFHVP